jgi:hypothetical protein
MRVIAVTAVVQLLLETIFTSPDLQFALALDLAGFLRHPWGAVTYLFVHGGSFISPITCWASTCLAAVEARTGSNRSCSTISTAGGAARGPSQPDSQQAPVVGASAELGVWWYSHLYPTPKSSVPHSLIRARTSHRLAVLDFARR